MTRLPGLKDVRDRIDGVDERIVRLLGKRAGLVRLALRLKSHRAQARDRRREARILARARRLAARVGAAPSTVEAVYRRILRDSAAFQRRALIGRPA